KVNGTDLTRTALKTGRPAAEIVNSWKPAEESFRQKRSRYLLYPDTVTSPAATVTQTKASPKSSSPPIAPRAPQFALITVSRGDTIHKIARDFGVTLNEIAEANPGTNVLKIKIGQKLRIPRS